MVTDSIIINCDNTKIDQTKDRETLKNTYFILFNFKIFSFIGICIYLAIFEELFDKDK